MTLYFVRNDEIKLFNQIYTYRLKNDRCKDTLIINHYEMVFFQENAFDNVVLMMATILPRF